MPPKEKAIELIDRMNNQAITIQQWQTSSDYAKNDLKRKVLIVIDEIIKELLECGEVWMKSRIKYWQQVKQEIELL